MSSSDATQPTITVGDVLENCVAGGAISTGGEINIETDGKTGYDIGDKVRNVEAQCFRKDKKINQTVASSAEATQGQFSAQSQASSSNNFNQANVSNYGRIGNHTSGLRSGKNRHFDNVGSVVCAGTVKKNIKSETNYVGDGKEKRNVGNVVAVGEVGGDISHKLNATIKAKRENDEESNEENDEEKKNRKIV